MSRLVTTRDHRAAKSHLECMAQHLGCTQPTVVDIRQSADWRLSRETADYLLWWTPLGVDLL